MKMMKFILSWLLFLLLTVSCEVTDSIDNYKGAVVHKKQLCSDVVNEDDYYMFVVKIYNRQTKSYQYDKIYVLDGSNYNVGDTIK